MCLVAWDGDLDDYAFALLGASILRAARDSLLSDEDLYPLLVRFWTGDWPQVDWPANASALVRRCATVLAARGTGAFDAWTFAPTVQSRDVAREVIVTELCLTPTRLLAALQDHWDDLADAEMPIDSGRTLLAFARNVLLEPIVGAVGMLWSTLRCAPGTVQPTAAMSWEEWSPIDDDLCALAVNELDRLGLPAPRPPADDYEAAAWLARARAPILRAPGGSPQVAKSLVRTTGWPGDTELVDPLAARGLELALGYIHEVAPGTDNDGIVDSLQVRLMPPDDVLKGWVRNPTFGTISDHLGVSRTGAEVLHQAAYWLTLRIALDAVDVVAAMCQMTPPRA